MVPVPHFSQCMKPRGRIAHENKMDSFSEANPPCPLPLGQEKMWRDNFSPTSSHLQQLFPPSGFQKQRRHQKLQKEPDQGGGQQSCWKATTRPWFYNDFKIPKELNLGRNHSCYIAQFPRRERAAELRVFKQCIWIKATGGNDWLKITTSPRNLSCLSPMWCLLRVGRVVGLQPRFMLSCLTKQPLASFSPPAGGSVWSGCPPQVCH